MLWDSGGAYSFDGNSVLRLHVGPGGGSTFVLSGHIPISPMTDYLISCQMRFNLESESDAVFFSVIQFDGAGNAVGSNELKRLKGDNSWKWQREELVIHTQPSASSIGIRFALLTASESYLDVDSVR